MMPDPSHIHRWQTVQLLSPTILPAAVQALVSTEPIMFPVCACGLVGNVTLIPYCPQPPIPKEVFN